MDNTAVTAERPGPWRITFDTNPGRLQPPLHHVRGSFTVQFYAEG